MIVLPRRYEKLTSARHGGFGNTVMCRDLHLDRKVIVKQINEELEIDRLTDEIEALQKARSKHVVQIYDVFPSADGKAVAIVEEFLPGNDLIGFRAGNSNVDELVTVLYQLASGIADIHDCGIVHRDIKPNNVKFDAEQLLKIFDFGLAKYKDLPASTVGLIGTDGFMAPELFHSPPIIDKPVDCYAFGATCFYFVTGIPPKCARHKPIPRTLKPGESMSNFIDLHNVICQLIDACLDVEPNSRPTAHSIRNALRKELLFGEHKATIIIDGQTYVLEEVGKGVRLARGTSDSVVIFYNGYDFIMKDVSGDVFVNNLNVSPGQRLEGSSVIMLGGPELRGLRKFVTFDISHPEVMV